MRLSLKVLTLLLVAGFVAGCSPAPEHDSSPGSAPKNTGPKDPNAPADVAAPPADAVRTASGLAYKILKPGAGTIHPTAASTVVAHYTGWQTDGIKFDSSIDRGEPITFPLSGPHSVIAGWQEGVKLMVIGEKCRFWIPGNLAYEGVPGSPQGVLVFDVELLDIK